MRRIISLFLVFSLLFSPYAWAKSWYTNTKPPIGSQINWDHPLAQGLVGCWLMNEGGGNVVNDIARNNKGMNSNAVWNPTKKGMSLNFNGTSSYVDCGNKAITFLPYAKTLFARIIINTMPTDAVSTWQSILDTGSIFNIAANLECSLGLYSSGGVQYLQSTFGVVGSTVQGLTLTSGVTGISAINTPYDIVSTWTGTTVANGMNVYVNGKLKGSGTAPNSGPILDRDDNLVIGRGSVYNSISWMYFKGKIIQIMLFNRALSPSEIQALYIDPYCFIKQNYRLYPPPTIGGIDDSQVFIF